MKLTRRITLRQLEVFCEAARQLSFSAVAETLSLSQPAISMQIRQLEDAVGLVLFEKAGRRKALTEAGRKLFEHASRILGELHDTEQSLLALKGLTDGSITVGLVSTANNFAPRLLAAFSQRHPGIEVRFVVGNREALVSLLKENQTDLAVMGRPPGELETVAEPLANNPHVIVAPPKHALCGQQKIDLQRLRGETFLQRESGSGTRGVMEELFRAHLFKPRKILSLGSNETVKQAVMAGLGLSVLSLHTLSLELRSGEIACLDVVGLPLQRSWHVVHLRRRPLSPAATAFRKFLIEETQRYLRDSYADLQLAAHVKSAAKPMPKKPRKKAPQ
ncbi:MAG: Transcriptional regulator, LysR family [Hydrocarboniphaga sp.]|uniref:LysR family transcriptional regulator n=1 Tax=Hydrocarboniphaga sp. TaxID=2033016 RepID=UPI00261BBA76|nr:LysR family transcriptional regulator [Hydrocarboniphaga sp.]MDB5969185.1 Transcriptional regulator, LysR family [Hydrocarboniphaga sp.]